MRNNLFRELLLKVPKAHLAFIFFLLTSHDMSDPFLKLMAKYKNHPSILIIGEVCKKSKNLTFSFLQMEREDISKEV